MKIGDSMGLNENRILKCLRDKRPSIILRTFETLESTNSFIKQRVTEDGFYDYMVVSSEQTEGQGRFNRRWFSPKGGLYVSFGFSVIRLQENPSLVGLVLANSVVSVLNQLSVPARIKWPNDIVLNHKKIGGILSELIADGELYSVIGVGLNLNFQREILPEELHQTATTVMTELESQYDIEDITCKIALDFFGTLDNIGTTISIASILDTWRNLDCTLGEDVIIETRDQRFNGRAVDITEHGFLIVKMPSGELREIQAGDVIHSRHMGSNQ